MFQMIPEIHPKKVNELKNYILVDVRKHDEFIGELGHIPGATLQTLGPKLTKWLKQQPKESNLIFICHSGRRAEAATMQALKLDFVKVYNMTGGMLLWNQLDLKTER